MQNEKKQTIKGKFSIEISSGHFKYRAIEQGTFSIFIAKKQA